MKTEQPKLDYISEWRKSNPNKVKEAQRKYRETHKEEIAEKRRINADKKKKQEYEYIQSNITNFLRMSLNRAKQRQKNEALRKQKLPDDKYACDIKLDYLLELWDSQSGVCAISGKKMVHKMESPFAASIDRIDSNIGYLKGNIQLVCQAINYAKNRFTNEQFLEFWKNDAEII